MLSLGLLFLVMLNPVALFLYLSPLLDNLSKREYILLVWRATLISGLIYACFIFSGDWLFQEVFQINFESFRLFGGIIIFSLAWVFIVGGKESFVHMRSNIGEMASQLAMPFMVGAGSISVSILIGNAFVLKEGLSLLIVVLLANMLVMLLLKWVRDTFFSGSLKSYYRNILSVVFRLNSFFMGAIGVDMIISAVKALFFL